MLDLPKILRRMHLFILCGCIVGVSALGMGLIFIFGVRPVVNQLLYYHSSPQILSVQESAELLYQQYPWTQLGALEGKFQSLRRDGHLYEISLFRQTEAALAPAIVSARAASLISPSFSEEIETVQQTQTEFDQMIWMNAHPVLIHIESFSRGKTMLPKDTLFVALDVLSSPPELVKFGIQLATLVGGIWMFQSLLLFGVLKVMAPDFPRQRSRSFPQDKGWIDIRTLSQKGQRLWQEGKNKLAPPSFLATKLAGSLQREKFYLREIACVHKKLAENSRSLHQTKHDFETRVAARTAELITTLNELSKIQTNLLSREQQLKHDALHDRLTGLPNRHYFHELLQQAIATYLSDGASRYSVLFLDLDHFKVVNDSLGHTLGDQFLQQVTQRLQSLLGSEDILARLGGDEFAILLHNDITHASQLAERLIEAMRIPFLVNTYEAYSGVSIGITSGTTTYQEPESILQDADIAMYGAKRRGRGQYAIFDDRMKKKAMRRLQLENDLRRAIALRELHLFYQPIMSIQTGQLVGFEGLARWIHTEKGFISPAEFIPIAEDIGLIHEIGLLALEAGCRQLKQWDQLFPHIPGLTISINLSPIQLQQSNLLEKVKKILTQSELPGHRLKLEITESSILTSPPESLQTLNRLKDLGIQLCIDDFGMGHSSLQRLQELPIDVLKIDRMFIQPMTQSHSASEVVRMIMALAHGSNMAVVAEGIEEDQQLEVLKSLNCEWGQGFLYGKPMPQHVVEQEFFPTYLKRINDPITRLHLAS